MAINEELLNFVKEALLRELPREEIKIALLQAGWEEGQIESALATYAELDFPIPVPKPKAYLSAREAFFYLVLFSTLYVSAFNLGGLIFHLVDKAHPNPDINLSAEQINRMINSSVAALVVALPIFLYFTWSINRAVSRDPLKRSSKVRKWLTYVTLFIAAAVLIGVFISLVYNLLEGEMTIPIVYKTITVAIIAAVIFGYYLWDLRSEEKE